MRQRERQIGRNINERERVRIVDIRSHIQESEGAPESEIARERENACV